MDNYPTIEDYLKLYKLDSKNLGFEPDVEIATSLLEDLKTFLDMVYDLGKLEEKSK